MNIEKRELLGYTLEIIETQNFKEYLDKNKSRFSTYSLKAFLKANWIPASYFLEQPENTQEDLLNNKQELINNSIKYKKYHILLLTKDNNILNASRIKYDNADNLYNFIVSLENYKNKVITRTFTKEGLLNIFIGFKDVSISKRCLNKGIFLDIPLMLNKEVKMFKGSFELPNENSLVDINKCIYTKNCGEITFEDYSDILLSLDELLEDIPPVTDMSNELDKPTDLLLTDLISEGLISESTYKKLYKYVCKNYEIDLPITFNKLLYFILDFDETLNLSKDINKLRQTYLYLQTHATILK